MNLNELFFSAWRWEPGVLFACAALLTGYAAAIRLRFSGQTPYFLAGVVILLLALMSPLAVLASAHVFSAHVLQHLLLFQVVPPLLLLGFPRLGAARALTWTPVHKAEQLLGRPMVGWLLGAANVVVWHLPAVYGFVLRHESMHVGQQLCLLVTGVLFWWPIAAPLEERRLSPLFAVCYLFAACSVSTLVGILITFAPPRVYSASIPSHGPMGIAPQLHGNWGLSGAIDQQLGGLLMWVPCCLVYLCAILATLLHWYRKPEDESFSPIATLIGDH